MDTIDKKSENLLYSFFAEQKQEIKDNGFSQNVAEKLPASKTKYNKIWTIFCCAIAILFFISSNAFADFKFLTAEYISRIIKIYFSIINIDLIFAILLVLTTSILITYISIFTFVKRQITNRIL